MTDTVLDASAVLAYLHHEPGWETVEAALRTDACLISAVNLAEVVSKLAEKRLPENAIRAVLAALSLPVHAYEESQALATGLLRPKTRQQGLSLGDRACLALAIRQRATALTTDRNWSNLPLDCAIQQIR